MKVRDGGGLGVGVGALVTIFITYSSFSTIAHKVGNIDRSGIFLFCLGMTCSLAHYLVKQARLS